jgi:hypothetical protein
MFEGCAKLFTILWGPGIGLYQGRKFYWSWSKGPLATFQENGNLSSAFKKADSQWEQIIKCLLENLQPPIKIISPSMFHLNRAESDRVTVT